MPGLQQSREFGPLPHRPSDLLPVVSSPRRLETSAGANRLLGGDIEPAKQQREIVVTGLSRVPHRGPHLGSRGDDSGLVGAVDRHAYPCCPKPWPTFQLSSLCRPLATSGRLMLPTGSNYP